MRKIKVLSTVGASGTIETNVRTLGELKPLLRERSIDYSGMKMMVGETRNDLDLDEAILPEGDFKLYLMPAKTKSGSSREAQLLQVLANTYAELAEIKSSQRGVSASPVVAEDPDMADLRRLASGGTSFDENEEDDWL